MLLSNQVFRFMFIFFFFLIISCGQIFDSNSVDEYASNKDENPSVFGELVSIPDLGSVGGAINPKPTNQGIYMTVVTSEGIGVGEEMYVYRFQPPGPSPRWLKWKEFHFNFHPTRPYYEQADQFAVSLATILEHDYCLVGINTNTPAHLPYQTDFVFIDILVDNSMHSNTWAIAVSDQSNSKLLYLKGPLLQFEQIATLPKEVSYLEATPDEPEVFAAGIDVVYKIDVFGEIKTFDVSDFSSGSISEALGIRKIRFSGEDTFFIYGNKIFKIDSKDNLELFHIIEENGMTPWFSDFAVDGVHVFTTQGNVLSKDDGELVANIIPKGPPLSDAAAWQIYNEQLFIFNYSPMEVTTDMFGSYIYSVYVRKILISPKKRFQSQY